jgi:hypothetical protein
MNQEEREAIAEFVVTICNANRQINEAGDHLINVLGKPILEAEKEESQKPTEDDFNALNWITKQGTKGDYQQVENDGSSAFKAVQQYIKAHKGFCHLHGFKIWLHNNNENLIDRKR